MLVDVLLSQPGLWQASLLAAALLSLAPLIYKVIVYPWFIDPLRHLPGPSRHFSILGYVSELLRRPPSLRFNDWIESIENDGLLRIPSAFSTYYLLPTSTTVLKQLLTTKSYDFGKEDRLRKTLSIVLGDGLIASEGNLHKSHRKNLMQLFGHRQIKNLHPLIWSKAASMVEGIGTQFDRSQNTKFGSDVEVYDWASRATLDIIGPRSVLLPEAIWKLIPWSLKQEVAARSKELHSRCSKLVAQKKRATSTRGESIDMLEHMIDADCFSDKELVDELLTFLAAGHETTSTAMTWALYALAKNHDIREQCQAEVVEAIDSFRQSHSLDSVDFEAVLDALPALHGVCNESQRLWPSVPSTTRIATRATTLADVPIPEGTRILIPIWSMNRLPEAWGHDAADFRPSRWIDAKTGKGNNHGNCDSNYAFMTYLHGPRSCLGQGLARAELKALLAAWLYCFEFELADPDFTPVAVGTITVRPRGGLHLRVRKVRSL